MGTVKVTFISLFSADELEKWAKEERERKWTLDDISVAYSTKGSFLMSVKNVQEDIEHHFKLEQKNPGSQRPLMSGYIGHRICSAIKEGRNLLENGYHRDIDVLHYTYYLTKIYAQQNGGNWPVV